MDYKNYNEVMEDIVQFLKMHDIPFVIEKKSQYYYCPLNRKVVRPTP